MSQPTDTPDTGKRPFRPHRSNRGRLLGGVCAGLAESTGLNPWLLRGGFILGNFLPGPGLLVYLGLWLALPLDPN